MDFEKRLDSLQGVVKHVLGLLQPASRDSRRPTRDSRRPTRDFDTRAIVGQLDKLSRSFAQLKEDFHLLQSSPGGGREVMRQTRGTATNEGSLLAGGVDCQNEGNGGSRNTDAVISIVDMGFGLVKRLGRFGTNFSGKIHISDLEDFDLASISRRLAYPDAPAVLHVQHSSISKSGISELKAVEEEKYVEEEVFEFPDFSDLPQPPQHYEKSFENIIAKPPRKVIIYYVGPPLAPDFNPLLSPGKLLELGEVSGVTTPYWHAGEKNSGTAFHCEDGDVRSCNITITGFKFWILVDTSSNAKFESFIKTLYPSAAKEPRCSQWVRHLNLLVSPQKLKEMDIRFDLVLAGPGDMVITKPGQYHAVLNLTACFAIAINFALEEDPTLSPSLACRKCGLYDLQHPAIQRLETITPVVAQPDEPAPTDSALEKDTHFEDTVDGAVSTDPIEHRTIAPAVAQPDEPVPTDSALEKDTHFEDTVDGAVSTDPRLTTSSAAAEDDSNNRSLREQQPSSTRSRLKRVASNQKFSKRSRQRLSPVTDGRLSEETPHGNIPSSDRLASPDDGISGLQLSKIVRSRHALKQFCNLVTTKRNSQLHNLFTTAQGGAAQRLATLSNVKDSFKTLQHINQYLLATDIEKARGGKRRVSSRVKKEVRDSGLSESQYDSHLRLGMKWRQICGPFDGVLCFLPSGKDNPWQIPASAYHRIDADELRAFHHLLTDNYTMALCIAGKAFQQSLGGSDIYFTWETIKLRKPLYELPEDEILSYIKPVPVLLEDRVDTAEFPVWPDPWTIPPTEEQCYCSSQSCNCYDSKTSETRLRIMERPEKGLYLQAVSEEPNAVVYKDTELLGFLTGRLIPSGTLDDDRVFDTEKCQVDCRDESNKFKLLHHACEAHAVARLVEKRVSGRFRLAVVARKDIYDGEEVTILSHRPCEKCEDRR